MKENIFKGIFAIAAASLAAYFKALVVPLCVLFLAMILDYITGMSAAWTNRSLNSRRGITGLLKKLGYMVVVAVGMIVDWLIFEALAQVGISIEINFCCGLLVTIWLIINEVISIIENAVKLGLPYPPFLDTIIKHIKSSVEDKTKLERE